MDPVEGGCGSGEFPRSLVLVIFPSWEAVGRSDRFLRAEGSEVQRKLFMGVRLRVPPAQCGQITDGGRNLSELFYGFFFPPLLASLLRLSTSDLWQVRMAAAAAGASVPLHCVPLQLRAVLRLGTRMSPPPGPHKMPLVVRAINDLRVG